ncbi:MAG: ornithine cyclodeaminase family protein [Nitrososphaerota archaeon]|nr:ornithine cyclodeaminase family protein [Nitrososphaerota archaeon]
MTILLSESEVESLLDMDEVVAAVEEAFRREGMGEAQNFMRTRTRGPASVLSVMHATSSYLGRAGLKAYASSKGGTRFLVLLFDANDSSPLAVMAADMLGRFRTGAASGVATKHLYGRRSGTVALLGSGKQALTQALALRSVMKVDELRVWSRDSAHREAFASALRERGFEANSFASPAAAAEGADVVSTITSSKTPLLDETALRDASHVNACGSNVADHAEVTPEAVGSFDTVVVDDLPQAKLEYGELIQAEGAGKFSWDAAIELGAVVAGRAKPKGRTLFKSGGAALEDVAAASLVYKKAKSLGRCTEFSFY